MVLIKINSKKLVKTKEGTNPLSAINGKLILLILSSVALLLSNCASGAQMRGSRAKQYIGRLEDRLTTNFYSAKVLYRRHPDMKYSRRVDAVIFNTGGGKFRYIKRADDDQQLLLDSIDGKGEDIVTQENIQKFKKIIEENKLSPYVLLDKAGQELAIVYADIPSIIHYHIHRDGQIFLSIQSSSGLFQDRNRIFLHPQPKDNR